MTEFRTYSLAVEFARICRTFSVPADLQDQLLRASSSIALNLKEGSARHTLKDRNRFYRTALGSARECEAIFDIVDFKEIKIKEKLDYLARSLNNLCKYTEKNK